MGFSERFKTLQNCLNGKMHDTSWSDFFSKSFFSVPAFLWWKLSGVVNRIEKEHDCFRVDFSGRIKNLSGLSLFMPFCNENDFTERALYQVLKEMLLEGNPHYYEKHGTVISSSDVVVDCGAAEGLFSLIALSKGARVYALEPVISFVNAMRKSFEPFPIDRWSVMQCAVSSKLGEAYVQDRSIFSQIYESPKDSAYRIDVSTIDKLFENTKISYLKADLEGYDYEAMLGARAVIKRDKPKIAVTTYHRAEHCEEISRFLRDIVPQYNIKLSGMTHYEDGRPAVLHAWVE